MNGRLRLTRIFRSRSGVAAAPLAGLAALCVALSGCADIGRAISLPPVNPESPVAAIVQSASTQDYATPRLTDIPPVPKNVPTADVVKLGVVGLVRCRAGMEGYVVDHPPLSGQPEAFASNARQVADIGPADVAPPNSAALTEAEADRLRAEAEPPAAIASGPPPNAAEAQPGYAPARAGRAPAHAVPHPTAPSTPAAQPGAAATEPAAPDAPPSFPRPLADPLLARCS